MTSSSAGAILAAVCAAYVKDENATIDEFDRIVREARNAMTGQGCIIKTIDKEAARAAGREEWRRKKEQEERRREYAKKHNITVDQIANHRWQQAHRELDEVYRKAEFADLTIDMLYHRSIEVQPRPGKAELAPAE
jgi:hypothetical protein